MWLSASSGSSSKRSNYSRSFELPEDDLDGSTTICGGGGAMLPIFLNGLGRQSNNSQDLVEVTLELEEDSVVVCSVTPTRDELQPQPPRLERNLSITSRIRRKFPWLRSEIASDDEAAEEENTIMSARDARRIKASLQRSGSNAQQALKGLRFISKSTGTRACDSEELWRKVESRFRKLAKDGLLSREDFGECIGTYQINFIVCFIIFMLDRLV